MREKNWIYASGRKIKRGTKNYSVVQFINRKTGKLALFRANEEALTLGWPQEVRDLHDIKKRKGVEFRNIFSL